MKRSENQPDIKVLMYHRVVPEPPGSEVDPHCVKAEMFRTQLQILDNLNYTPITFEDYHLFREGRLTLPKKPIIITFDDGHLDTCNVAIPILREFNMRAVVFVMGNREKRYADWDTVHSDYSCPLMTDQQIREVRAEGFEIGAHSMSHKPLTELDEGELREEIHGSKRQIETLLGEPVISFAYPYGRVNSAIQEVVKNSGYRFGCGVYSGPPSFGSNRYDIRRLAIHSRVGSLRFLLRAAAPYHYLEWFYGKIKSHNSASSRQAENEKRVTDLDLCPTNNS